MVEFPGARFDGSVMPILVDLEERGIIRVLDLVARQKDADGTLEFFELSDLDEGEIGGLRDDERQLAMLLSEDDVLNVATSRARQRRRRARLGEHLGRTVRVGRAQGGRPARRERPHPGAGALAAIEADQAEEGV